jgi:FkbM family methyltransferase
MSEASVISRVLDELNLHPVLVDVGASGGPPSIWDPLAPTATYVGFDPDSRDRPTDTGGRYRETHILGYAVTSNDSERVRVFLTRSPHCSSTLPPDAASLSDYAFAPLFDVVSEAEVPARSLVKALAEVGLAGCDWIKLDTQGTDLRIFQALPAEMKARTLAVDVEPGLIDAYKGEDLFVDVHREMCAEGFWLSRLDIDGTLRCRRDTVVEMMRVQPNVTEWSLASRTRPSPGWCQARYLRTPASLPTQRDRLLLAVFALLDEQPAFAFETVLDSERLFGSSAASQSLKDECLRRLRQQADSPLRSFGRRVVPKMMRRRLKNVFHALTS